MSVLFGKRKRPNAASAAAPSPATSLPVPSPATAPATTDVGADAEADKAKAEAKVQVSASGDARVSFLNLGVDPWLVNKCELLGIRHPTPVQAHCIPPILAGRDVMGCAQTGSGKTAAFALPILHVLSQDPYGPFALVLTPTRELAFQIAEQFAAFGSAMGVRCAVVVGGVDMLKQALALQARPHIIIATPGRLHDHLLRPNPPNVSLLKFLVLDEADRLLDASFAKDLSFILDRMPARRQTLLFSATMTANLDRLEQLALASSADGRGEMFRFDATPAVKTVATLQQFYLFIPAQVKMTYLMYLLSRLDPASDDADEDEADKRQEKGGKDKRRRLPGGGKKAKEELARVALATVSEANANAPSIRSMQSMMVFVSTCKMCALVGEMATELGVQTVTLHSMMSQARRLAALGKFRSGAAHILVSTDVASRGLDIPQVDLVLNFDLPRDADDYIHRVGRTARAGRRGQAISLVTQHDIELLQNVERATGKPMDDYEPQAPEGRVLKMLNDVTTAARVARMRLAERGFDDKAQARKAQRQQQRDKKLRSKKATAPSDA